MAGYEKDNLPQGSKTVDINDALLSNKTKGGYGAEWIACLQVYAVPTAAKRGHKIPQDWRYRRF